MQLSGKKLTTAILAGLMGATMFGGSVFAEVTDQQILELQQGVNANTQKISQLENAQQQAKDYSKDIDANKKAISDETTARTAADTKLQSSVDANAKAITDETTARTAADTKLQSGVDANTKAISDEATARDKAVAQERAERKGADAAQDKVIKQVNDNLVSSVNTINKNIGTITDQLNKNDLAEQQARAAADKAEADARAAADTKLQDNIDNEAAARQKDVSNLQKNITDSLASQGKINETLTTAVQNNSKAIVDSAKNLEKHLSDTDSRVDKANAEIHTNAGNIAQSQKDIADIQNTLKDANALASADATKAATKAANDATAAAENATTVAKGLDDRITLISNNQTVTSESDLIKKDHSIGQNLTNVDAALHDEIAKRIGADKAQDKLISDVTETATTTANNLATLNKNVADGFNALSAVDQQEAQTRDAADKALQDNINKEASDRADADTKLNAKMDKGFSYIDGQLVDHQTQINQNKNNIKTNADNIQKNTNAIEANSDKLKDHEGRITTNEGNIERNAEAIKKETNNRIDADTALQKNIDNEAADRQAADQNLQTQINNNNTSVNNEAAERKAADQNLQNQINNNSTSINDLYGRYSSLKTDINKVGARSAALAGLHPLDFDPANKLNFAVASGSFKGENSVALGAFYRPNENIMFSAASTMGDSDNAYTFGLSFKIGPSSAKTKTTSPDAEELYKVVGQLQDQLAAQQKEIEQLKANKAK